MIPTQNSATQYSSVRCRACPSTFLCTGPATIQAQMGYWFPTLPLVWKYASGPFEDGYDEVIIRCLSGACRPDAPLKYIDGVLDPSTSLCTFGRDMLSPLCSECLPEYSADLLSDKCLYQPSSSSWPIESIVFFVFSLLLVIAYLVFLHVKPLSPQSPWLRIVVNFYSVIGILYTSTGGGGSFVVDGALHILSTFTTLSTNTSTSTSASSLSIVISGAQPVDLHLSKGVLSTLVGFVFALTMALRWLFASASRRHTLKLVFVVVSDGITQQLLFGGLTAVCLVLHVRYHPYNSRLANYTETVSYLLLLFVNMLNFSAVVFTSITLHETPQSRTFLQSLFRAQSALSFVGLLLLGVVMAGVYGLKLYRAVVSLRKQGKCHLRGCTSLCKYFLLRKRRRESARSLAIPLENMKHIVDYEDLSELEEPIDQDEQA
mmetsp:Transcript_46522/g.120065  ORF Transcript_46522/g.120065 Transcript_46522/m.120065 type:complete len:432 (-) Transcript_46522:256-1551(-)